MKYLNLYFQKSAIIDKMWQVQRVECKKQNYKIFIFQWDIFRIQRDKTPIGLHGGGRESNLSDRES